MNKTVFISYSHDDDDHKAWVNQLALKLKKYRVRVLSDIDFPLGGNLMLMMNQALESSYKVLVICTDNYNNKANNGLGGAGYESHIASAMIMANQDTTKFIPIIRNVSSTNKNKTPISLLGRSYLDMSNDQKFNENFITLVKFLTGEDISYEIKNEKFENYTSTSYFDYCLKSTFPDVNLNKLTNFYGKDAVDRLDYFFEDYKDFTNNDFVWWFRGSDNAVHHYQRVSDSKIMLGDTLYDISSITVYSSQAYYQSFIYFDIKPENPTGLYPDLNIQDIVNEFGYSWEEYAIYKNMLIKSNDYYNGATVVNGIPQRLNGEAKIVTHYTTKYNFILAASSSPYSSESLRRILPEVMNAILSNKLDLEVVLKDIFLRLPKRS
ncbi:toll/interleukin-1 receptor domain-containing protein [Pectobacterium brasiliense]|uniref:toll/interleukin-1 receptor domain-containing protein n=1 Tax=Pectobacterium brasiliense TaxID=180957 RepID=UPI0015DFC256|nr:toll/interleukin-1 receptor domain-containing protein [Pectobacterium brasiliense]MBA0207955.1 toll/interleukin-1 receptor domain-containing protein [Pectobacterium brasiliense]